MWRSGKLNAKTINKFPEFVYNLPVARELTVRSIYPDRVNFMEEYPRWSATPSQPILEKQRVIEYQMLTKGKRADIFQIWLKGNEYTKAKACKLIGEYHVSPSFSIRDADEILYRLLK